MDFNYVGCGDQDEILQNSTKTRLIQFIGEYSETLQ